MTLPSSYRMSDTADKLFLAEVEIGSLRRALEAALSELDEWRANATEFKELCSEWEARATALEKVLEPFARQAASFDSLNGEAFVPDCFEPAFVDHTIGDLRAARAALSPKLGEEKR
jgi:hypothetical protein